MGTARDSKGGAGSPDVSVVVPTFREAENLPVLIPAVARAIAASGLSHEIIIVDDNSRDGSEQVIAELGREHGARILVRTRERGLSSAVIHGFSHALGRVLVCMDADLSHPPETVPLLAGAILAGEADFVLGSRYVAGASVESGWSFYRRLNSLVATLLARPLTRLSDPMSGFFALRREAFESADALDPVGYKIALELLVKARPERCMETPIHFRDRLHGESKLTLKQQLLYVQHVGRLVRHVRSLAGAGVKWTPPAPSLLPQSRAAAFLPARTGSVKAA